MKRILVIAFVALFAAGCHHHHRPDGGPQSGPGAKSAQTGGQYGGQYGGSQGGQQNNAPPPQKR